MLSVDFTGGAASHVSVSEENATLTLDLVPRRPSPLCANTADVEFQISEVSQLMQV